MSADNGYKVQEGLRVLLGVSGSIAAYKTPQLVRDLIRAGAEVRVALTPDAENFVSLLALTNVSRHPVASDIFAAEAQSGGSWHIHLAHWCDLMLVAPCSATTLARLAAGFADNAPTALALALPPDRPLLLAPAMDTDMWLNKATQRNVRILQEDGVQLIGPAGGELASGIVGPGRLAETEDIIAVLRQFDIVADRSESAQFEAVNIPPAEPVESSQSKADTANGQNETIVDAAPHISPASQEEEDETATQAPPVVEAHPIPQQETHSVESEAELQNPEPEVDIVAEALKRPTFPLEDAVESDRIQAELDLERIKREQRGDLPKTDPASAVKQSDSLRGLSVVISAGPTREKIDDVRFLTNHSSGKMGYALAEVAAARGATVTLVSGPTQLDEPENVHRIDVQSANDMFNAVMAERERTDVFIMSAAVADFTPAAPSDGKIKKTNVDGDMNMQLKRTPDILAALGEHKQDHQIVVGFALEAVDGIANATDKLERKNADMIVLNHLNKQQSGFGGDENTITLIRPAAEPQDFEAMTKIKCAEVIWDQIEVMGKVKRQ